MYGRSEHASDLAAVLSGRAVRRRLGVQLALGNTQATRVPLPPSRPDSVSVRERWASKRATLRVNMVGEKTRQARDMCGSAETSFHYMKHTLHAISRNDYIHDGPSDYELFFPSLSTQSNQEPA